MMGTPFSETGWEIFLCINYRTSRQAKLLLREGAGKMDEIVQKLGTPEMIAALEANMEEEMMGFGRALAGGEIYNDGEVEGFFTGRTYLNGVLRTHLRNQDEEYSETRIKAVVRYFQEKEGQRIRWAVGQATGRGEIEVRLYNVGFVRVSAG